MKPNEKYTVLSIKYGGHDTSAAIMIDDKLIAACEQERYTLDKHSRLFPIDAIKDCLNIASCTIDEVDELAFVNDLKYYIQEYYLKPAIKDDSRVEFLINDIENIKKQYYMEETIRSKTGFKGPITYHFHHLCHLASSYYPSGFKDAILASYDGSGEIETSMLGIGRDGQIEIVHRHNYYPHSLGLLYSAITYYLGWKHHCDEGIVMGLASYGNPHSKIRGRNISYYEVFKEILQETGSYDFIVDQSWMKYYEVRDTWISEKFTKIFGPKRAYDDPIMDHHKNIAAALQLRLETVVLNQLRKARDEFGLSNLCIAGGVALNCSMNGKILSSGIFEQVFVQPAASDAGTPIGACYLAQKLKGNVSLPKKMHNFYTGSRFIESEIFDSIKNADYPFEKSQDLYTEVARLLKGNKIVGWFQGEAEFGPRALGNRSILCSPYPEKMKDYINQQVKFRESFRPFAPAVLYEYANKYFDIDSESPHMLIATQVAKGKREVLPAVVHVDGTCRVQTVRSENNIRFYKLLTAFMEETGIPVLLNTSFNVKGQPIVNTPDQAIKCFLSTRIDCLVLGDYILRK
jgi:carbamoyltransferase